MSGPVGWLALVLHAHLPFVRHPEHERFLEETWLFEAITETYVPLLKTCEQWVEDKLPVRIALTVSPTLGSMLQDSVLMARYSASLERVIEFAEREVIRTSWVPELQRVAEFYLSRLRSTQAWLASKPDGLLPVFRRLQELGVVELITCAATHAILPFLLERHPPSLRAQLRAAREAHRAWFGADPQGIWLPECAYTVGLDEFLAIEGIRWFVTDTHGVMNAEPRPRFGTFRPLIAPSGVAAFGRDLPSARQVWSRHEGYPGDPRYREFHRDAGFELDYDYVRPLLFADSRSATGLKYYAVTGSEPKKVYDRTAALEAARTHADHFVARIGTQLSRAAELTGCAPVVLAPYDAELFGHWWYEGPEFLDLVVRRAIATPGRFKVGSPTEYLKENPVHQIATPSTSSWGEGGYWAMWLNHQNEWVQREVHIAERRMDSMLNPDTPVDPMRARMLNQAGRELLLAQASDWPFILKTGTSPDYARSRVRGHLASFHALCGALQSNTPDLCLLETLEQKDNIFPLLHYSIFVD
jgi:1,4-alpha-glucan branching enzyme